MKIFKIHTYKGYFNDRRFTYVLAGKNLYFISNNSYQIADIPYTINHDIIELYSYQQLIVRQIFPEELLTHSSQKIREVAKLLINQGTEDQIKTTLRKNEIC